MDLELLVASIAKVLGMVVIVLVIFSPITAWLERKQAAVLQDRVGPNRANVAGVTLFGLLHPLADAVKFLWKEDFIPARANRMMHNLAPLMALVPVMVCFAVVPFGEAVCLDGAHAMQDGVAMCVGAGGEATRAFTLQVANLDIGILFVFAFASLATYGVAVAGWASNNKFALLGGLRAAAQMFSYEIVMGLNIVGVFMVYGSLDLAEIVRGQAGHGALGFLPPWGVLLQPVGCILFLTSAIAESKRVPFDNPEGESEIIAGYHLEYSSAKFMMFFMGEYMEAILAAAIGTMLFFGGWHVPFLADDDASWAANYPAVLALVAAGGAALGALLLRSGARRKATAEMALGVLVGAPAAAAAAWLAWLWVRSLGEHGVPLGFSPATAAVLVAAAQVGVTLLKMFLLVVFQMFVRWTLPRFRYDQVMKLGWKMMLPVSLANIAVTALVMLW
jgi:NADH-quinone oxidoreductase subunit H